MKRIIFYLFISGLFLQSCNNDLVITEKWKDIPVVFALLNVQDTAHYFRIEKAFLDSKTSADSIAQISDSLYYNDITVQLKRISTGQTFTLTKVDGNLEGYPRESGTFATSPNYLYKIKQSQLNLDANDVIKLIIKRDDEVFVESTEVPIVNVPELYNASTPDKLPFSSQSFNIAWRSGLDNDAVYYDLIYKINYIEESQNGTQVDKIVWWDVEKNLPRKPSSNGSGFEPITQYQQFGADFYNYLSGAIAVDPNVKRYFKNIEIYIWSGGKDLYSYVNRNKINSGITSLEPTPSYSNLDKGFGIVTSRSLLLVPPKKISDVSLDSLVNGSITKKLNFQEN